MITAKQVLDTLDNYRNGYEPAFVELSHPYFYPIDSRINVFTDNKDKWAIAIEVFKYDTTSDPIALEITYFGNCLINLDEYDGGFSNNYWAFPVDEESYNATTDYLSIKPEAEFWIVRGEKIALSHNKQDYINAGIELEEFKPNVISIEEVGRYLVTIHQKLFRATDGELYKSIPKDLKKILVIDEWYHRNFHQHEKSIKSLAIIRPTDEQINKAVDESDENDELLAKLSIPKDAVKGVLKNLFDFEKHEENRKENNDEEWNDNRPSSYETWQLIAKVIETGHSFFYKPTLKSNSHWKNWPESGSM